jgi:hypothetical protein
LEDYHFGVIKHYDINVRYCFFVMQYRTTQHVNWLNYFEIRIMKRFNESHTMLLHDEFIDAGITISQLDIRSENSLRAIQKLRRKA